MFKRLIATSVFIISLVPLVASAQDSEACTVRLAANSEIFAAPDEDADVLGLTTRPATFEVFMQAGNGWYRVVSAEGKTGGWIQMDGIKCEGLLETADEQPNHIALDITGTVVAPRVNVRQGPGINFARVGRVVEGDELSIIAQSDANLPWYLVDHQELGLVWVRSDLVTLGEVDDGTGLVVIAVEVEEQATGESTVTNNTPSNSSGGGNNPAPDTPPVNENAAIVGGRWSHTSTLVEHGCTLPDGPQPGDSVVISFTLTPSADNESVTITYDTGVSFTLYRGSGRTYSGSYGSSASVHVSVTFDTPVSYTGSETVIHPPNPYRDTECVIRSAWSGHKG
ncbi:MAG: SH3 domain-containing protein [Chloroflexi bacterium]|nr:SH3 domain-containing protein [Chloroflexota bacterium]